MWISDQVLACYEINRSISGQFEKPRKLQTSANLLLPGHNMEHKAKGRVVVTQVWADKVQEFAAMKQKEFTAQDS